MSGKFGCLLLLSLLTGMTMAQEQEQSSIWQRFSVTLTSSFNHNPWENYNGAVESITAAVERDKYFLHPTGFYEKINGDIAYSGNLGFAVGNRFEIILTGQIVGTSSGFEFFTNTAVVPRSIGGSPAFHQQIDFSYNTIGIGLRYDFPLADNWSLQPRLAVERYSGTLDINWLYSIYSYGPIEGEQGEKLAASLKDQAWGGKLGMDLNWNVFGGLSVLAGIDYRLAEFDEMSGSATYGYPPNNGPAIDFDAELFYADGFFGVHDTNVNEQDRLGIMPAIPFIGPSTENSLKPAVLNFNSFGLTTGIQWRF